MTIATRGLALALLTFDYAGPAQELAISVNVDLVVLHATVRDGAGRVAGDLREQNFEVFEDGERQTIRLFRHEDLAVTAGLVVDHSGSMRAKLSDVVEAARAFVRLSSSEDEMFVVNFNDTVTSGLPQPPRFSNRQDELAAAIANTAAEGQTALYDAVGEGLRRLQAGVKEKKVLLVISDGADNVSKQTLPAVLQLALRSNTAIYTIGIFDESGAEWNPGVLRRLAKSTGGESFQPRTAGEVPAICERIATDIRRQYTIGYISNRNTPAGVFRKVRLTAKARAHQRLTVLTRSGYMAGERP